uniref:Uncharacterized protein n=1 Tax=Vitis vinifera TaxID=29760 RepID=F6H3C0_VITVI
MFIFLVIEFGFIFLLDRHDLLLSTLWPTGFNVEKSCMMVQENGSEGLFVESGAELHYLKFKLMTGTVHVLSAGTRPILIVLFPRNWEQIKF